MSWWSPSGLCILSSRSACAYFRGVLSPPQVCAQLPTSQTNQGGWGRCHLRLVWKRSRRDGLSQRYSANPPEEEARLRLAGTGSRGMLHQPAGRLAPSPPCKHENQQLPRRAGQGVWATHFKNCGCGAGGEEPACQDARHRRHGFHPWIGTIPGEGNDGPLQPSCLENSMDRGAWWASINGVAKSQTRQSEHTWLKSGIIL